MALAHPGVAGIALLPHEPGPQQAVTNVGLAAKTIYRGGICQENSYIVQEGSLLNKGGIHPQLGVQAGHFHRLVGHSVAVHKKQMLQFILLGVIFVDDCVGIHRLMMILLRIYSKNGLLCHSRQPFYKMSPYFFFFSLSARKKLGVQPYRCLKLRKKVEKLLKPLFCDTSPIVSVVSSINFLA